MASKNWPIVLGALCLTGCVVEVHSGPTRHEFREFERKGVERLRLDLHMAAGELKVRGGATELARADFTYNVDPWKPEVTYHALGGTSDLSIEQPSGGHTHVGDTTYIWDIKAADDVPLDLIAHLGAGKSSMDLGSLSLRRVEVEMGVGELHMDLRGKPTHDYEVHIRGGIGEATVHLPSNVGVYAAGTGGIGEIHVEGLRKQGGHWVNDAYNDANVRIRVDVEGGIGQIDLIAD
jgi:N-terminal domain of toast_rack, DUF2154